LVLVVLVLLALYPLPYPGVCTPGVEGTLEDDPQFEEAPEPEEEEKEKGELGGAGALALVVSFALK